MSSSRAVQSYEGAEVSREAAVITTANSPFCDGSHTRIGFVKP